MRRSTRMTSAPVSARRLTASRPAKPAPTTTTRGVLGSGSGVMTEDTGVPVDEEGDLCATIVEIVYRRLVACTIWCKPLFSPSPSSVAASSPGSNDRPRGDPPRVSRLVDILYCLVYCTHVTLGIPNRSGFGSCTHPLRFSETRPGGRTRDRLASGPTP